MFWGTHHQRGWYWKLRERDFLSQKGLEGLGPTGSTISDWSISDLSRTLLYSYSYRYARIIWNEFCDHDHRPDQLLVPSTLELDANNIVLLSPTGYLYPLNKSQSFWRDGTLTSAVGCLWPIHQCLLGGHVSPRPKELAIMLQAAPGMLVNLRSPDFQLNDRRVAMLMFTNLFFKTNWKWESSRLLDTS